MANDHDPFDLRCADCYRRAMDALERARVPFLVGGAFALQQYASIFRDTKDFDIFVRPSDAERALAAFAEAGFRTEMTASHWLGKARENDLYIDVIFSSGNGVATVDDVWFDRAVEAEVLGRRVRIIPPEEMLWSKGLIMERERFDGADVIHVIRATAERLDWDHLMWRYDGHWRVLLAHLVLFGFVYPTERWRIPARVMRDLVARLERELATVDGGDRVVYGTLLSRTQYLPDLEQWGYKDARALPPAELSEEDTREWDEAGLREAAS